MIGYQKKGSDYMPTTSNIIDGDLIFQTLFDTIHQQQLLIKEIADKLEQVEMSGGGSGNATISDYESNKDYERNTLVVDVNTETVYRVLKAYKSKTVEQDCIDGNLKLVGFESQIVTFNGNPTQSQINVLPEDTLVAIYSASDAPYQPNSLE
jgi:hypothetical protein